MKIIFAIYLSIQTLLSTSLYGGTASEVIIYQKDFPASGLLQVIQRPKALGADNKELNISLPQLVFFWKKNGEAATEIHSEIITVQRAKKVDAIQTSTPLSADKEREALSDKRLNQELQANTLATPTVMDSKIFNDKLYILYWNNLWTHLIVVGINNSTPPDRLVKQLYRDTFSLSEFVKSGELIIPESDADIYATPKVILKMSNGQIKPFDL